MGCCCPMLLFIILVFETVCVLCKYPCKCYKKVNFKEIPCMRDVGLLQHWKVTLDIENIVYEVLKYMLILICNFNSLFDRIIYIYIYNCILFSPGPGVRSGYFKPIMPRTRIFSLTFWASADAMPMGFTLFPSTTICSTIIKIKPTPVHIFFGDCRSC